MECNTPTVNGRLCYSSVFYSEVCTFANIFFWKVCSYVFQFFVIYSSIISRHGRKISHNLQGKLNAILSTYAVPPCVLSILADLSAGLNRVTLDR